MMLKRSIGGLIAALAMLVGVEAFAQTDTGTLVVNADVRGECTIDSVSVLNFGAYYPATTHSTTPLDGTATITYTCASGTFGDIYIDLGGHPSGGNRYMYSATAAASLQYELYSDSGRTTEWVTTDPALNALSGTGSLTVYGRVPPAQTVGVANDYTDSATVTIVF